MYTATFKADNAQVAHVATTSLKAMSIDYRNWIRKHDLGASNCCKVIISQHGHDLFVMSYNGRIWDLENQNVEVKI